MRPIRFCSDLQLWFIFRKIISYSPIYNKIVLLVLYFCSLCVTTTCVFLYDADVFKRRVWLQYCVSILTWIELKCTWQGFGLYGCCLVATVCYINVFIDCFYSWNLHDIMTYNNSCSNVLQVLQITSLLRIRQVSSM